MRIRKKDPIQYIYKVNPESQAVMIEISLDSYDELFNGWDASPLKMRDLEPELMAYILEALFEISFRQTVELWCYIPVSLIDLEKERKSIQSIRNNFNTQIRFIERNLFSNYRKIVAYIALSIVFLLAAYFIPSLVRQQLTFSIIIEGLFIGGWVLLWEAFSLFFFASYDLRKKRKRFIKLLSSNIYFHPNNL